VKRKGPTVRQAEDLLLTAVKAEGGKPATLRWYHHRLRPFIEGYGDREVGEITIDDVREYMAAIQERKCSEHTKYSFVRVVRRLFKWLFEEQRIQGNFYRKIRLPRLPQPVPKGIEMADASALLRDCSGDPAGVRDKAIMLFLLDTGCRAGGLCNLKVSDLDLDERRAQVYEKGDKGRFVLLRPQTCEALRKWLGSRAPNAVDRVFTSLTEPRAIEPNTVVQMLRRRAKRAGVGGRVNPHSWRHAFAREWIRNGGDLASLSDMMGHTQIAVTKRYAVFLVDEHREKHDRFSPVSHLLG
jgi:site-specific recombinase XerD